MRVARTQKSLSHRNTLGLRRLKLFFQRFGGKAGPDAERGIDAVDYVLKVDGRVVDKGKTAADGSVEMLLPVGVPAALEIFGTSYDVSAVPWLEPAADVIGQQRRLSALGYHVGNPDGTFGEKTDRSALEFQADCGLQPDGMIGGVTQGKLTSEFGE